MPGRESAASGAGARPGRLAAGEPASRGKGETAADGAGGDESGIRNRVTSAPSGGEGGCDGDRGRRSRLEDAQAGEGIPGGLGEACRRTVARAGAGTVRDPRPDGGRHGGRALRAAGLGGPARRGRARRAFLATGGDARGLRPSGSAAAGRVGRRGRRDRGSPLALRRPRGQDRVARRGRAGLDPRRRPLPRRLRHRRLARHGAADAAPDAARGRLLERGGAAGPRDGAGKAGGKRETERLLTVMEGLEAGRTQRGIAIDVWGAEAVAGEWGSDSWMRAQVRRWIPKAKALADGGWRAHVPRRTVGDSG